MTDPVPAIPLQTIGIATGPGSWELLPSELLPGQGEQVADLGEALRDQVSVYVIHDGRVVPAPLLMARGEPVDPARIHPLYLRERDWGASLVAGELVGALGIPQFLHVHLARVVMDFGRFPGLTPSNASYMERFAINSPFSQWLDFQQKRVLLERWYDAISDHFDQQLSRRTLAVGVHTYDVYNASGTLRPEISILNRALSYQTLNRMPAGIFDPLYPDRLGEFTCDRALPSRISLHLERAGLPVALNFPYCLPEGSVEVRSQVWHFFEFARLRFMQAHPDQAQDPMVVAVWRMLLDTNLRSSESEALRSYLHMFRTPPRGFEREFAVARKVYERIQAFIRADSGQVIDDYRFGQGRPGAIGIEIRKDLVWELDEHQRPVAPRPENARRIARLLAEAIARYFHDDRANRVPYNNPIRTPQPPHERRPSDPTA